MEANHHLAPLATLEVEASMDHWEELNDFIELYSNQQLGSGSRSYRLRLACEELFSNIIRHSGDEERTLPVLLTLRVFLLDEPDTTTKTLMVEILDNGPLFDPQVDTDRVIPSHLPASDRPIGGLGLFLVQQSVDRLQYDCVESTNRYRLFVNLDSN